MSGSLDLAATTLALLRVPVSLSTRQVTIHVMMVTSQDSYAEQAHGYRKGGSITRRKARAEELWSDRTANLPVAIGKGDGKGGPSRTRDCLHAPRPHHDIPAVSSSGCAFTPIIIVGGAGMGGC